MSDETLKALGVKAPIPREYYARYIRAVYRLGAPVQIIDLSFSPTIYRKGEDDMMKATLESGSVIHVAIPTGRGPTMDMMEPLGGRMSFDRFILAHPELTFVQGVARMIQGVILFKGKKYYAISLKALSCLEGKPIELYDRDPPGYPRPWFAAQGGALRVGERVFHLVDNCLFINFYRAAEGRYFTSYTFEEIAEKQQPPGLLKGKVVLLGNTERLGHDIHSTPLGPLYGTDIHALFLRNLLDGDLLLPVSPVVIAALILLIALLAGLVIPRISPLAGFASLLLTAGLILWSGYALYRNDIVLEIAPFLITLAASYLLISLSKTRQMERELDGSADLMEMAGHGGDGDITAWLSSLLRRTCTSLEASAGWIQIDEGHWGFEIAASWNCPDKALPDSLDGGLCRKALTERRQIHTTDPEELSPFEKERNMRTILCTPLSRNQAGGALILGKTFPAPFTRNQVGQVHVIATLIGALLDNVKLNRKIQALFLDAISSLAQAVDARDPYTFGHSERVASYAKDIASHLALPSEEVRRIEVAGVLHDIGKIGVPESILHKRTQLTEKEFAVMKKHPETAVKILRPLDEIFSLIPVVAGHHEKLDGTGYPSGLKGEEIPLGARILAVADVFDALTSDRPYRRGTTPGEAMSLIRDQFKTHLDGPIIDVFERVLEERGMLERRAK
jgi:putative nucleotidyltransferase with HDIG domain